MGSNYIFEKHNVIKNDLFQYGIYILSKLLIDMIDNT